MAPHGRKAGKTDRVSDGNTAAYWSRPADEILAAVDTSRQGLAADAAAARLLRDGPNTVVEHPQRALLLLFLDRFRSPILLILIIAALIALLLRDWVDALIVLGIIFMTAVLSFIQEYRASNAVEKLKQRVSVRVRVLRGGQSLEIPATQVVRGDIVQLSAGSLVPADALLLEATDFHVSQALLTGETYPVQKQPGVVAADASLARRSNVVFMGTSVRSGTATAVVVQTARDTVYGGIADSLTLSPPETDFERGLRRFGGLLMGVMGSVVIVVLAANILLQRPTIDTLLFAMALAVGMSPELLPAILSITLSRGARNMAAHGVIVRRLNSIENLGSMNVLCSDKTGTLTQGVVQLDAALDVDGQASDSVLRLAGINSQLQAGLPNALDEAVVARVRKEGIDLGGYHKHDEVPYDFVRRRLSIVVDDPIAGKPRLITKGALQTVLDICDRLQTVDAVMPLDDAGREHISTQFKAWSAQGYRVLGVASKPLEPAERYSRDDEQGMVFCGFLLFFDPPEPGVRETIAELRTLGVDLKIITGDNSQVARHVAEAVGMPVEHVLTGAELATMKEEALWHLAPQVSLFAEVDPNQKERIIRALQQTGHVVGYLGDGINDAPALHAADVGISVDTAADVAKEAADFVLLEHDLKVLKEGIECGRQTFANTLKYIFITTSANFGNMISMALASVFLPFLPLLAKQVLLNNFLSDIPAMGVAGDEVDREWIEKPREWDIRFIRRFMITFGLVSSLFDMMTFAILLYFAGEIPEIFRTGWFIESLLTELVILFIMRTPKPFYRSRPGRFLALSALAVTIVALLLPVTPVAAALGFVPLPASLLVSVLGIVGLYAFVSEWAKRAFYRHTAWD